MYISHLKYGVGDLESATLFRTFLIEFQYYMSFACRLECQQEYITNSLLLPFYFP